MHRQRQKKPVNARRQNVPLPRKSRASRTGQEMGVSDLHKFQLLLRRTLRPCPKNRRTTPFASGPISFPNAAADSRCLVTPSPIGSKRSASCWLRLGAKVEQEQAIQNGKCFGRPSAGAARTPRDHSERRQSPERGRAHRATAGGLGKDRRVASGASATGRY